MSYPKGKIKRPLADRFWQKVDKNGPIIRPELGPCWIWTGAKCSKGYGHIGKPACHARTMKAAKVALMLAGREVPAGQLIRHRCDNPPCVRQDHLILGSAQDNSNDAKERGRLSHKGGHFTLTADQVSEIRILLAHGIFQKDIAAHYGVYQSAICKINRGYTWKGAVLK